MFTMTQLFEVLKEKNPIDPYVSEDYDIICEYANNMFMGVPIKDCLCNMPDVTDVGKKLFKFLENQNVLMHVGFCGYYTLPCPSFVTADAGFKAVYIPEKDMYEEVNPLLMKIAHETGHFLDLKLNYKYNAEAFKPHGFNETMVSEIMAWHYAELLLEAFDFEAWDEFEDLKYECLLTYANMDNELLDEILADEFFLINEHEIKHAFIPC